jgi:hypothetical protein
MQKQPHRDAGSYKLIPGPSVNRKSPSEPNADIIECLSINYNKQLLDNNLKAVVVICTGMFALFKV